MSLATFFITTLGHAIGLLLDIVALLILIRAVCSWRRVPVLTEFNDAGKPLVNGTLQRMTHLWRRFVPNRPLTPHRLLFVTWLAVIGLRWVVAMLVKVTSYVG